MNHPRSASGASPVRGRHQRPGEAGSAVAHEWRRQSAAWLLRLNIALIVRTAAAWLVTLLLFFPLGWLMLTAFKTELQAINVPPLFVFPPTLENFVEVQARSDYLLYAKNSIITSVLSTLIGLAIAAPAAYSMAFFRTKRTRDILLWMLSTKMMPAVGALVPVYVLAQKSQLLDTQLALIVVFALSNLPIMVWMLYSHFKDIPHEILEAARMDGATLWQECRMVLLPLAMGGLASTGLLCLVLAWNEAFWALNLSAAKAGTLAALIASYSSPEGLFWAKLSAASLMAIAPIIVFGWLTQKQLVQGLTFGAVK
jgi:sorbitol/mannitol transport system permease protein